MALGLLEWGRQRGLLCEADWGLDFSECFTIGGGAVLSFGTSSTFGGVRPSTSDFSSPHEPGSGFKKLPENVDDKTVAILDFSFAARLVSLCPSTRQCAAMLRMHKPWRSCEEEPRQICFFVRLFAVLGCHSQVGFRGGQQKKKTCLGHSQV